MSQPVDWTTVPVVTARTFEEHGPGWCYHQAVLARPSAGDTDNADRVVLAEGWYLVNRRTGRLVDLLAVEAHDHVVRAWQIGFSDRTTTVIENSLRTEPDIILVTGMLPIISINPNLPWETTFPMATSDWRNGYAEHLAPLPVFAFAGYSASVKAVNAHGVTWSGRWRHAVTHLTLFLPHCVVLLNRPHPIYRAIFEAWFTMLTTTLKRRVPWLESVPYDVTDASDVPHSLLASPASRVTAAEELAQRLFEYDEEMNEEELMDERLLAEERGGGPSET